MRKIHEKEFEGKFSGDLKDGIGLYAVNTASAGPGKVVNFQS